MTDVDAVARELAVVFMVQLVEDSDKVTIAWMEQHISSALRERDAEWQAEISRLTELPDDVRSCGELSCDDCNARTAQLRAEVERLREEVRDSRQLAWHLIESAGGRVQISDLQLASVGPHDDCRVEWFVDARHRCTELRSVPKYSATTT